MTAYIFQAALLCKWCGEKRCRDMSKPAGYVCDDESSWDSDDYPKGPYAEGGGEADTPQHCDDCGLFLENPLTRDGGDYVRGKAREFDTEPDMSWCEIAAAARRGGEPVLADWVEFYLAPGM